MNLWTFSEMQNDIDFLTKFVTNILYMNIITDATGYVRLTTGTSPSLTYRDIRNAAVVAVETFDKGAGDTIPNDKVIIVTDAKTYELYVTDNWYASTDLVNALTVTQLRDTLNTYFAS